MRDYITLQTLKLGGQYYKPGMPIQMEAEEAAKLVADGGAWLNEEVEAGEPTGDDDPSEVIEQIVAAIGELDPETDYTAGGEPNVAVLSEKLEMDITAAQRDEAFAIHKSRQESSE